MGAHFYAPRVPTRGGQRSRSNRCISTSIALGKPGWTVNIVSLLDQHARNDPDAPAVIGGTQMTYGELATRTSQAARLLASEHGVRAGDRVGIVLPNTVEFLVAFLGAMRLGAVPVPLNTRLRDADLAPLLDQVGAHHAVVEPRRAAAISGLDIIDAETFLDRVERVDPSSRVPVSPQQWGDVSNIVFTSGSTSGPKAVLQTHGMHIATGAALSDFLQLSRRDVTSLISPMFHVAGLTMLATVLTLGSPFLLHPGWRRDVALDEIDRYGVTFVHLVGAVFLDILTAERDSPSQRRFESLRVVLMGGAVVDAERLRWFEERLGCRIIGAYGRTEGGKSWCDPDSPTRWTDHGVVNRNVCELRIADPTTDAEVAPGSIGEIQVRGDGVSRGYDGDPAITRAVITNDGWMRTGDQGYVGDDNVLRFLGRADGMIKTGGENVSPQEVEHALVAIPGVIEAAVAGIAHERLGQTVGAVVVAADPQLTAQAVQDASRLLLAGFKIPRTLRLVPALPRLGSQKIDMPAVRALLTEHAEADGVSFVR